MRSHSRVTFLRRLVMAGALAVTLAGIAGTPALADDWGHRGDSWRDRDRREHEWRERERWREHEWRERFDGYGAPRYYYAPGYVYAPPPVVYPPVYPPPAYVTPGLNLGFYFR
jgi:hypothetical protein